ncbi:O-methyltransferase [Diaporthe amygdali]|uniref:O-methyltransferase n=1 Tax=Phomopsis amygdali TaxID=1214568 RepID=UPI0022FF0244|nr:O-methyltransferase [Diaporthe amygdali]KAJ0120808.1 O-methyltransferase [Diaporthe amygdali]
MAISPEEALNLAAKLEAIADNPESVLGLQNDLLRQRLREAGRKLSHAMEIPVDTARRLQSTPLELPAAFIGVEKGIFSALASQAGTTSTEELAEKTQIDPVLLKRLLRFYQANNMISQPGDDAYGANNITKGMNTLCCSAGVEYFFETVLPAFTALPQFLRDNGYKNPTNPDHLAWHAGHKTELNAFPWLLSHPRQMEVFMQAMATLRDGMPNWFDIVDFREEVLHGHDTEPAIPLFVDVGGAMGQQCIFFKKAYPDLEGRVIVQDQAQVVSQIEATPLPGFEGIEAIAHDFFKPQPIKGARAYYLRMIFHDWPDHKAVEILRHLRDAMTESSYLLIDDTVLSEKQAPWKAAFLDMTMMCQLGAQERTKAQWERLTAESGFKILKICEYAPDAQESLIIAVKSP